MTASRSSETLIGMNICRSRGGWATLALSVAIYAAVSGAMHQPFHMGGMRLRYFDLRIYHLAALRLGHGSSLYGTPMMKPPGIHLSTVCGTAAGPAGLVSVVG